MRVNRLIGMIAAGACFSIIIVIQSCNDKGTEPPPNPITIASSSVSIVPNTSRTIQITGGVPPFRITRYPRPQIGTASWDDSTKSPANLTISVLSSATVHDVDTVTVGDSNPLMSATASVFVEIVDVGNISFSDDVQPIFEENCTVSCHPGGGAPFSLNKFVSYNNLFYFVVSNMSCGAVFRVVPFQPDSSLLYLMISGKTSCPRMPYSPFNPADTLSFEDQTKIRQWIEQGAANN